MIKKIIFLVISLFLSDAVGMKEEPKDSSDEYRVVINEEDLLIPHPGGVINPKQEEKYTYEGYWTTDGKKILTKHSHFPTKRSLPYITDYILYDIETNTQQQISPLRCISQTSRTHTYEALIKGKSPFHLQLHETSYHDYAHSSTGITIWKIGYNIMLEKDDHKKLLTLGNSHTFEWSADGSLLTLITAKKIIEGKEILSGHLYSVNDDLTAIPYTKINEKIARATSVSINHTSAFIAALMATAPDKKYTKVKIFHIPTQQEIDSFKCNPLTSRITFSPKDNCILLHEEQTFAAGKHFMVPLCLRIHYSELYAPYWWEEKLPDESSYF